MDQCYRYLFIRQDLPVAQQIVQSGHAIEGVVSLYPQEGIPNLVAIGVPDVAALNRVLTKLKANQIEHFPWVEPDGDLGFTAIATIALNSERKKMLANYRLYSPGTGQPACSVMADRGANARCSSA